MNRFTDAIARALADKTDLTHDQAAALIELPRQESFGDYAFPCFQLAKSMRKAPQLIAQELAASLELPAELDRAEPVGPYINFFVDRASLAQEVIGTIAAEGDRYGEAPANGKTVVIDFSSPNVYKPMGVHHLRTTVIGNALRRLHARRGWNAVGVNYLGDWGTTFGQLMVAYMWHRDEYAERHLSTQDMVRLYVEFHDKAESRPELNDEARSWFRRLERGDEEAVGLWRHLKAEGLEDFKTIYDRLDIHFDVYSGESVYNDRMGATLERLRTKGLVTESEGALVVDLGEEMPPCLLQKSDGGTTYALRDLAAAEHRYETYAFDLSLYVVAQQQRLHFRQVFKVLELMGYDWAPRCVHVDFGMLSFAGEKFATRKGNVIFLDEVLDRAVEIARGIVEEKNPDLEDKESIAEMVGAGAIVFDDFRQRRGKDIVFDWNEALNFDGETGPYLQYTYVRLGGILRKAEREATGELPEPDPSILTADEEARVLRMLGDYAHQLQRAVDDCEPSVLARYLLDVAGAFNLFYQKHRVVSDEPDTMSARLALVRAVRQVIRSGLETLGVRCPERM
jgi:arginyl-tRNA synthetase